MNKAHIHVLTNPREVQQKAQLIRTLAPIWEKTGYHVTFGGKVPTSADLALLHIDRSKLEISEICSRLELKTAVNRHALDITKRQVSRQLVNRSSDWDGPVIIKTDANAHGAEDYVLERLDLPRLARILAARILPWKFVRELPLRKYPILKGLDGVPDWVWQDNRLVVERFLPEMEAGAYVLRIWVFLGKQEYAMKILSTDPIVKSRNVIGMEMLRDVPDEVREHRHALNLDYGKIDYVMHSGRPVVLDANKTPVLRRTANGRNEILERLASGIAEFLS
jgi:hypothetical protein